MTNKESINFALRKITTEQFATVEKLYNEENKTGLSSGVRFGLDEKNKIISVFTKFSFEQNQTPFLLIETACHFAIDQNAWTKFHDIKSEEITLPKGFITHLAVLTVGTARGVLHAKTENTFFNKFVLPTINLNKLIKEDVVFNLAGE